MKRLALAIVFVLGFAPPAWADFQAGVAAFNRGDYAAALRQWKPLAEQGNASAQFNLGGMYRIGQGLPQDYVQAHKWYNLAASRFPPGKKRDDAAEGRDYFATRMTAAQIAEAQRLVREWKPAKQGNAKDQNSLGLEYYEGRGVTQDDTKATKPRLSESDIGGMTNDRERTLCNAVTEAVNDGSVEGRFEDFESPPSEAEEAAWNSRPSSQGLSVGRVLKVDYDGDGEIETLGYITGGGSCGNCDIEDIAAKESALYPTDDAEERLRWASWGKCDYFLFVDGEPIVLTGNFSRKQASLVSWLAPDGAKRALCYLGATPSVRVETVRQEDPALCQAVAEGNVDFLVWSRPVWRVELRGGPGWTPAAAVDTPMETLVDIDLDGEDEIMARVGYSTGAGCGTYNEWLAEMDPETHEPADSVVNTHLTAGPLGPMPGAAVNDDFRKPEYWSSIQILRFENKPYILARGEESDAAVYSLWDGELHSWCEYTLLPQHQVEKFYPVETWP